MLLGMEGDGAINGAKIPGCTKVYKGVLSVTDCSHGAVFVQVGDTVHSTLLRLFLGLPVQDEVEAARSSFTIVAPLNVVVAYNPAFAKVD